MSETQFFVEPSRYFKLLDQDLQQELLFQTLEQAIDAVVIIDEQNLVAFFNAAAETLWGWPRDQVIGHNVSMLVPLVIRDSHDGYVDANRATGINRVAGTSREVPVDRKDGHRLWASMSISKIVLKKRVLYTAFLKDITAKRLLHERTRQLSLVADHSGSAIVVTGADRRITYVNEGFTRLFGYEMSQAQGRFPNHLLSGAHTDPSSLDTVRDFAVGVRDLQTQVLIYARNGRPIWASLIMNPVCDSHGQLEHIVAVLTDITHTKMHEVLQQKVLDAMAHDVPLRDVAMLLCRQVERIAPEVTASLLQVDSSGRLHTLAAPSMPPELGALADTLSIGPEVGSCGAAGWSGQAVRSEDIATDPHWAAYKAPFIEHGLRACWSSPVKASDGTVLGTFAFYYREPRGPSPLHEQLVDVSLHLCALLLERQRERQHIHQLAYYDTLTGLPNRSMLIAQTQRLLHDAQSTQTSVALLFIDLDRFKHVNDTHGHLAGDGLLRALAARLQSAVRDIDVPGRLGGDEFVVVLPHCTTQQAAAVAQRLCADLSLPVDVHGATLRPSASIGIAMFPEDGTDSQSLLGHADMAMYQAKTQRGGKFQFYSARLNRIAQEQSLLETDLRSALQSAGLTLHYQPLMAANGSLYGVEALLRWKHATLGDIEPMRFVALAEERGLIDSLSQWVVGEACRQMSDWRQRGVAVPHVGVNLSPSNLRSGKLPLMIATTLREHGLLPSDLRVEVTETALLDPHPNTLITARALHAHGVLFSLDDFGTGQSSLAALHRLPISALKLDKGFVQDLGHSASARALTSAVLRIGESLNMPVVAEGVETKEQSQFLSESGCLVQQGYLFSRPLAALQLEGWLQACSTPELSPPDSH